MSNKLHIYLFGTPQFTYKDKPVTGIVSNKARALLIYLAVTGLPHSRDALAELLWADTPASKRTNLKRALSNLRNLDGVRLLEEGNQSVALDPGCYWADVTTFEQLAHDNEESGTIDGLQRAAASYQDDFLADFPLSLSYEFEAWALNEQTRLKEQLIAVLNRLASRYAERGDLPQAIVLVRRLLQLEPWREAAHQQLMTLLVQSGDRSAALQQFEQFRLILAEELVVEPSAMTLDLVDRIRNGTLLRTQPVQDTTLVRTAQQVTGQQVATTVEFPLVGREAEWQIARTIWQTLDQPQFLCIGGEAGIGKTRLAEELMVLAEQEGAPVARSRSHALQGQLAYGPITDWLRTAPLQAALMQLDEVWLTEIARLLPELLIDRPTLAPPPPLRENWQRKRFFDALCQAFTTVANPLLLVIDDLQWSDVNTLEWLQYLVAGTDHSVLIVGTVRADEIAVDHPLHHLRQQLERHDRFTDIALAALTPASVTALAQQIIKQQLTSDWVGRLFADTAGNPLFVIESLRSRPARVTGVPVSPAETVGIPDQRFMPAKMYSVIQARLGQLTPEAQYLAQLAATIGRSFDVTLLAAAANDDEETVLLALDELWQRRVIREIDHMRFDFSHDRIRDVAYTEIGPVKQRLCHRHVARALETIHGEQLDAICGQLAVHYETAGLFARAIANYQRAADGARKLYANQEAVTYRQKALHVLRQLPKYNVNLQTEVDLLLALSEDRTSAKGRGHPAVADDLLQAYALAETVGTPIQQVKVLNALTIYDRVCGKWITAQALATKSLAAAEQVGDPALIAYAYHSIGCTLMRQGNLEEAQAHFEHQPDAQQKLAEGGQLGFMTRSAHCLWLLGFPKQAVQRIAPAVQWVPENSESGLQVVLHQHSSLLVFCRDPLGVDQLSAKLVKLATKRGDEFSLRWGQIYRGWLLVQAGDLDEGTKLIRDNADEHRAQGNYFYECFWRAMLAEAYLLAHELDAAFKEIDSTLAYAKESGDHHLDAQLLKLKGDCLQAGNVPDAEVEHWYQLAIDTAHQQKSRSLELRATISLCRLWQKQSKMTEAHALLAAIYGWFTEGFDTGDLVEAKELLSELAAG